MSIMQGVKHGDISFEVSTNPDTNNPCPVLVTTEKTHETGDTEIVMMGFQTVPEAMHWLRHAA